MRHARAVPPPQGADRGDRRPPRIPALAGAGRGHHQLARLLRLPDRLPSEDDDDTIKLCRIQYLGDDTNWAFAIWQASSDSYAEAVLLDGHRTGHPNQALDTACTLYLASPGDEPAEPLKDLRGAALDRRCRARASSMASTSPGFSARSLVA